MTTQHAATQPAEVMPLARLANLTQIASMQGPCVTLVVPTRHPGAPETSQRFQVRSLLDQALNTTAADKDWVAAIRKQVESFVEKSVSDGGAPGFVVYATAAGVQGFQAPGTEARGVVADRPNVVPLLEPTAITQDMVILALSTKHLKLFVYADGIAEPAELPATIPANLDAAGHFHRSGSDPGQNRTPGGKGGVRFGTSGERESAHDSIQHFCAMIDHGLQPFLAARPLLLMGVKEEIAAYRRVSHCASLLDGEVDGNVETLTPAQISTLARNAACTEYRRLGAEILAEFKEMRDRQRASDDPRAILQAAVEGRAHKVCLRAGTELQGPNGEDLLNAIAVETLRKGGEVYLLGQDQMPVTQSACAILRF